MVWFSLVLQFFAVLWTEPLNTSHFTDWHDINSDSPISFSTEIDPHNLLTNTMSIEFVHLQENKVEYYEVQQGTDYVLR